ncbi:hypothetical protein CJD36_017115 [Flavipsychrobacter stenotrophus]|uniref:Uncharacterized protein n=1 Tax=Flavipsychrobacter stenotrophus TaxID=2077091 RepID=A0A2S7ST02_9BACT|nr:hypothetical protein [Flavipsychrobacter stenotrophus]PQJ09656.1 hypothetical protein CJD36_017115 [Flavipsychrobacter stenotrophus]
MKLEQQGDTYIFTPEVRNRSRVKGMLLFQSAYFIVPGIVAIGAAFFMLTVSIIITLVFIAAGAVLILAGTRYAKKASFAEEITIAVDTLTIAAGGKALQYELGSIEQIFYTGYSAKTDHPLKTGGFDYMGFETREREIARIHDEGHIKFYYGSKTIWFGKELASWDAQKISDALNKVTDGRLYIQNLPDEIPEDVYMHGVKPGQPMP